MKIKLNTPILEYNGDKIYLDADQKSYYDIRLGIKNALNTNISDERQLPEEKSRIYDICKRLYTGNTIDLTIDDLALIKKKAEEVMLPLYYGRLLDAIDPKS